jgi:hypothetical protein
VFAGLAFLILPLVFTIVGIALGVVNIIQARIGHGVAQIGLSIFCGICGTLIGGAGFGLH